MAAVALHYGVLAQGSLWYHINLLAGMALPSITHLDVGQLRGFSLAALIIGTIVHGVISLLAGPLYAVILPMLPRRHMLWRGGLRCGHDAEESRLKCSKTDRTWRSSGRS